jgi:hypothetical protein
MKRNNLDALSQPPPLTLAHASVEAVSSLRLEPQRVGTARLNVAVPAAHTPPAPGVAGPAATNPSDLSAPELLLNRELTWLNFQWRVQNEAKDSRNPLLERLKFVSIVASNIDEFFMKRIGGLKQQVGAGLHQLTPDGRTPLQQIGERQQAVAELGRKRAAVLDELLTALRGAGVWLAPRALFGGGRLVLHCGDLALRHSFLNICLTQTRQGLD